MYTICAHPLFKFIQTNFLLCFVSQILRLTFFAKYCKNENKNMTIISTIVAMLKTGELEEIIENGRIKLRAMHQDI